MWGGVAFGLGLWLAMMVSPPFHAMGFSNFGLNHGLGPATVTLLAHLAYGAVFGVLQHRWVHPEPGPAIRLIRAAAAGEAAK